MGMVVVVGLYGLQITTRQYGVHLDYDHDKK